MIEPVYIEISSHYSPELPMDLVAPNSSNNGHAFIKDVNKNACIVNYGDNDCIIIPFCMTRDELEKDIPKFLEIAEKYAISIEQCPNLLEELFSYEKHGYRYYLNPEKFISPYRDGKYGLAYLGELKVQKL